MLEVKQGEHLWMFEVLQTGENDYELRYKKIDKNSNTIDDDVFLFDRFDVLHRVVWNSITQIEKEELRRSIKRCY